ncbi:phosphatidylethanolamine N-methyltransferase [Glutinoglossum americanum]|uniref:Phosphatidylethanolamine N-methyltransferase n=1 Tax=Glutinoglossum americanum TaxID=1670608 RepID=A0A9P8I9T4_9PEZI|nr:phosphatidylethanolamine N-methyltransferase [Glutinoglossum americanum]
MGGEPQKRFANRQKHEANGHGHGLRARQPSHKEAVESCDGFKVEPHPESANGHEAEKEKKTFGRTPDGTVFTVPQTHDMVSQLLSPTQPKNLSDIVVLAILALLILTLYILPSSMRIPTFAVIFLFWRGCYNIGIGYLLRIQSQDRLLVKWAEKSKLFEDPALGKNPHPQLYQVIKRELETKIPKDYSFEEAPIEYNTWLVFRRVVDLILMCDFVSYCLFAMACGNQPVGEGTLLTIARWLAGWALVSFNLWVKLDAHRVVKDYAWYWGDFFYLIDQELTFDGVFEMAPHPMYSVGYAGYYGISLLAASYKVLAISIIAHAAQFAFLILVENPHIEKIYNPPPPRKRPGKSQEDISTAEPSVGQATPVEDAWDAAMAAPSVPSPVHNLLGLQNVDLFRITDISVILLQIYMFLLAALTPSTPFYQALFVLNAIAWRLWYSVGLGFILNRQSNEKAWTRHFVKFGESPDEAWRQWKGMYHLSLTMCHAGFIAASWKMYSFPSDWNYGLVLLKHIIGAMLIALQIWTAFSIYDSLKEFGWFFGDFFFDQAPKLTYSGIYRYLNNPERVLGLAGIWGAVLIARSTTIFCLALLSHILALSFIQFVERPHMQKLYGRNMRREAGLVKSIKRSLPPPLKNWHGNVDKVLGGTVEFVEDFIESARPKLAAGVGVFVKDASALFSQYPARISLTRVAPDLAGYDPKDYNLEIEGTPLPASAACDYANGKEGAYAHNPVERRSDFKTKVFEYGTPIRVKWTAPLNHSKKDWVGLYKVVDNASRDVTKIASAGRWVATTSGAYDSSSADDGNLVSDILVSSVQGGDGEDKDRLQGEMMFRGDKLWWTQGVFEFRYHHDGKHNVMAISLPFEIRVGRFDEDDVELDANGSLSCAVKKALLPVVRNCFDKNSEIAPNTVDEEFGPLAGREAKYAKRVVFAVQHMFGIEFAPEVVKADGSVKNLAWRICNAKKVLAPYSMSVAMGTNSPTLVKY